MFIVLCGAIGRENTVHIKVMKYRLQLYVSRFGRFIRRKRNIIKISKEEGELEIER